MIILSHRGLWRNPRQQNTIGALKLSLELGFGIETDIRDYGGTLVISHDVPDNRSTHLRELFEFYKNGDYRLMLALNIKSDGLHDQLSQLLSEFAITNYFVFDMSVPDGLLYAKNNFRAYTRQSEYESLPAFYDLAQGVWLDEFEDHWISEGLIKQHLRQGKEVCIVSPELHKRSHLNEWCNYREWVSGLVNGKVMLCTDFPEKAREYFNGKN